MEVIEERQQGLDNTAGAGDSRLTPGQRTVVSAGPGHLFAIWAVVVSVGRTSPRSQSCHVPIKQHQA